jgi:hypothetical protein
LITTWLPPFRPPPRPRAETIEVAHRTLRRHLAARSRTRRASMRRDGAGSRPVGGAATGHASVPCRWVAEPVATRRPPDPTGRRGRTTHRQLGPAGQTLGEVRTDRT